MKKTVAMILGSIAVVSALSACGYAGVATAGDKAVVLRNDAFLFGALRKAFVCKISDAGLTSCNASDAP